MDKYDLIIVGAGPAGIFCAYELISNKPDSKILIVERGKEISKRVCPKRTNGGKCVNCPVCAITAGFSGSGAFSDGKLTLTKDGETGGYLFDIVGFDEGRRLIKKTDDIYLKFGAPTKLYGAESTPEIREIRKKAISANLKLVECPIRHLGTDGGYEVYTKLQEFLLSNGVEIKFNTTVEDIILDEEKNKITGVKFSFKENGNDMSGVAFGENVAIGVGRPGAAWFDDICRKHNIKTSVGIVDIGVRVECRNEVMEELNNAMYEAKLIYRTPTFDDKVRTFCTNPGGAVSTEVYPNGMVTANGHAYADKEKRTENTNFALLVSKHFTEPFNEPIEYGEDVAKLANKLAGGKVLVQRFGDFQRGRRSRDDRMTSTNLVPTLKDAIPGDLSMVLPYRFMKDIEEMILALDKVAPGIASEETLLYGVEVKFYSNKVEIDENFKTSVEGLFAFGDGAGASRGLIQASANGIKVGEYLSK